MSNSTGGGPAISGTVAVDAKASRQASMRALVRAVGMLPVLIILGALVQFGGIYLTGEGRFLSWQNLSIVAQQASINSVLGAGMTFVILTGGIDLSVGSILAASAMVGLIGSIGYGYFGLVLALLMGTVTGLANGALIAFVRLPPFIVTLGTWNVFYAINLWYSDSATIRSQDIEDAAPGLQWFGNAIEFGGARFIYGSIFMVIVFVIFWYVLNWTPWGRHVHAIGDDPESATLAGISTQPTLLSMLASTSWLMWPRFRANAGGGVTRR